MDNDTYRDRINTVRKKMQGKNITLLLISSPEDVLYLAGFWGYAAGFRLVLLGIPLNSEPFLLTPKLEWEAAREMSCISNIRYYIEWPEKEAPYGIFSLLKDFVTEHNVDSSCIGIEEQALTFSQFNELKRTFPKSQYLNAQSILEEMRMIKSPEEIELMRKCGQVAISGVDAATKRAAEGVKEYEITLAAMEAGTKEAACLMGKQKTFISPIIHGIQMIASGKRTSVVHARPLTRAVKSGDMLMMCFCELAFFQGYRLGFTRMLAMKKIPEGIERMYQVVLEAQAEVLATIKPGVKASDLDSMSRAIISRSGYGDYLAHRTGRGVGLGYVERPEIKEGDETILEPGMSFTVEPAIYVPGKGGVRVEDTIVVTSNGYEELTTYPKEIRVV